MKKQRNIKILSIVALVLAITGMTLGFAAFSTTLSISSSATVTPDSDDFKVELVGVHGDNKLIVDTDYTTTTGNQPGNIVSGKNITDIRAYLTEPGDKVRWFGFIENRGEYDAYFAGKSIKKFSDVNSYVKCVPAKDNGVSSEYIDDICDKIEYSYGIYEWDDENETVVSSKPLSLGAILEKKQKYLFMIRISLLEDSSYPDGAFEVFLGDAELKFSTVYEK